MNPKLLPNALTFDSKFESGNLDLVMKPADREDYYFLFMRPDSNSNGNLHWFYFSLKNGQFGKTITLNIANFTKYTSLFEQGFQPSVFSLKKYQAKKVGWHRTGDNLKYNKVVRRGRVFFTLEFDYKFEYEDDIVWFATCIPYTYSTL